MSDGTAGAGAAGAGGGAAGAAGGGQGGGQGASAGAAGAASSATGGGAGGAAGGAQGAAGEKPFYSEWGLDNAASDFVTGKAFKTGADLVKSAMLADKLVRDRNVVAKPDPANLGAWEGWKDLGWTPDAAAYKLPDAKVPAGFENSYDKGVEGEFATLAHDARLPPAQAAQLRDGLLGLMAKQQEARAAQGARDLSDLQAGLRNEWGQNYDKNTDLARRAAQALGVDMQTTAKLQGLMDAPSLLRMFAKVGESMSEDTLRGGGPGRGGGMDSQTAAAEQRRLSADPAFMKQLTDARHPQHKEAQQRWAQLIEAKVGKR